MIVPLFALANAGIAIDGDFLAAGVHLADHARDLVGYVVGKPVGHRRGVVAGHAAEPRTLRPPVGWAAVAGGGTIAGIGFTVALLVATLAFDGPQLEEAKLGILSAALCAAVVTWLVFRATALLPRRLRIRGAARHRRAARRPLTSTSTRSATTSAARSTRRSPSSSTATSSARTAAGPSRSSASCSASSPTSVTSGATSRSRRPPRAQLAAEAAEAAAAQGAFWEMHDLLLAHQDALGPSDLVPADTSFSTSDAQPFLITQLNLRPPPSTDAHVGLAPPGCTIATAASPALTDWQPEPTGSYIIRTADTTRAGAVARHLRRRHPLRDTGPAGL